MGEPMRRWPVSLAVAMAALLAAGCASAPVDRTGWVLRYVPHVNGDTYEDGLSTDWPDRIMQRDLRESSLCATLTNWDDASKQVGALRLYEADDVTRVAIVDPRQGGLALRLLNGATSFAISDDQARKLLGDADKGLPEIARDKGWCPYLVRVPVDTSGQATVVAVYMTRTRRVGYLHCGFAARGEMAPVALIGKYVVIWLGEGARIGTEAAHRELVAPDDISPYTKTTPIDWD